MALDLVIRGGSVVDGSGKPRYGADVGIKDGRIVEIGKVGAAARTIDADGLIVAPGFIDGHTHMDAQVAWDPLGSCSCWHGVTSVVMSNCGFALAPCKPADREWYARCLSAVEDIPTEAMAAGIDWTWETFPEYLATVERLPKAINYGMYIGHSALAHVRHGQARSVGDCDRRRHGAHGRGRAGGVEGRSARLLELACLHARHAGRHAGRQPHRRMGGDRPHHRRHGRTRRRYLPGRTRHRQRPTTPRFPRSVCGSLHCSSSGRSCSACWPPSRATIPWAGLSDEIHRRHGGGGRPHVRPGHDQVDQRHLLAEILPAVRRAAGDGASCAPCRWPSRSAGWPIPRCGASWWRPRRR